MTDRKEPTDYSGLRIGANRLRVLLAKPWLLPDLALAYFLVKLGPFVASSTGPFGWPHAIFYPRIDKRQRYAPVAQQIKTLAEKHVSVLDVGGGDAAIREFVNPKEYQLCVLDVKAETLERVSDRRLEIVAGDGCCLPFVDGSFDAVVSVDSLEHVPDSRKADYCQELKRVARMYVILHCPADDVDGKFQGTAYDTKFLEWYRHRFKRDEPNTVEHLDSGLPKLEELENLFPRATIAGKQNGEIWLRYMKREHAPYVRLIAGLLYKVHLGKKDDLPPYHACLLVWRKR